ncbi:MULTISPECIES: glycosyltransferase family 4 protein [Geobacillus]|uniref:glycosyltransferase family 4 protein n=1 Tax=Geobacillus TaxID=129337 RepID=UPI00041203E7|nr:MULTISPECIES: MraY family glycosyltransferase [Geobacillus]AOL35801.1 undecaprenyl-phosphate alpha-N-acetylglucosaminyl 1-phosphate transferase [Geobacillus thermoleovorans]TRY36601.1 undecaprenyl/decaprenyl-phosphate alpha-N-acetylglucosaminyl 1-phosphate transferase [Geobacillus sp. LEMMJ02]WMJ19754.1 MraY family glycosyltransferase [Geobacillus kaustophilus]GAJ57411.1 teichoic acid linkage unit synthesis undecaprenylpyrophosphate-N-aetylglucosamine [Geobacillus thermoleovorans B23]
MLYMAMLASFVTAVLTTPAIKRLALKIGAVDKPNSRKVHEQLMPRLGGLAIYISVLVGFWLCQPESPYKWHILLGSFVIIVVGFLDDLFELPAKAKLAGQVIAALIVIFGGVQMNFINLPFGGTLEFGVLSVPLTVLWIVAVTNAINLIDGLDGLAAGVSTIALITISGMAVIMGNWFVVAVGAIMIAATLGFLIYNFHPAKIFMGDTGALFLGYMISVLSLLGFKNVTVISFIIPIIILGVPLSDTFFAIVRRIINRQPISAPDKSHLHHCLLRLGYSHRQTVLMIYGFSAIFGLIAVIFSQATTKVALFIVAGLLLFIELIVEKIGLIGGKYKPLLNVVRGIKFKYVAQNRK